MSFNKKQRQTIVALLSGRAELNKLLKTTRAIMLMFIRQPKKAHEIVSGLNETEIFGNEVAASWTKTENLVKQGGTCNVLDLRCRLELAKAANLPAIPAQEVLSLTNHPDPRHSPRQAHQKDETNPMDIINTQNETDSNRNTTTQKFPNYEEASACYEKLMDLAIASWRTTVMTTLKARKIRKAIVEFESRHDSPCVYAYFETNSARQNAHNENDDSNANPTDYVNHTEVSLYPAYGTTRTDGGAYTLASYDITTREATSTIWKLTELLAQRYINKKFPRWSEQQGYGSCVFDIENETVTTTMTMLVTSEVTTTATH